jgi:hypothetical protein
MPDRVVAARRGWRGRSSPELRATRQWCSIFGGFLPTEPVECEELTKGVFYRRGGGGFQNRTCDGKVQASTFSNGEGTL